VLDPWVRTHGYLNSALSELEYRNICHEVAELIIGCFATKWLNLNNRGRKPTDKNANNISSPEGVEYRKDTARRVPTIQEISA